MFQLQLVHPTAHGVQSVHRLLFAPVKFLCAAPGGNLNKNPFLRLPDEVLRQILECAARADRRTALSLALLSRSIQPWIDDVIYAEVHLLYRRTARLFLRTIQEHPRSQINLRTTTKPYGFFANAVKSMFLCSDIDPEDLVTILNACRGVRDLSYWPVAQGVSTRTSIARGRGAVDPGRNTRILKSPFPSSKHRIQIQPPTVTKLKSFDAHVSHISPRSISVLLQQSHPIFIFQPRFGEFFFRGVTHLSVLNRWEEWTTWVGSGIDTDTMPCLVCLKFDLAVGQAPFDIEDSRASRSRWLETVAGISQRERSDLEEVDMDQTEGLGPSPNHLDASDESAACIAWTNKMERVSCALSAVLNNHATLKVCVLTLRFDKEPTRTANVISRLASSKFRMKSNSSHSNSKDRISENVIGHAESTQTHSTGGQSGFDPRLVFAWEREPFRYSYAHSAHERMIWVSAEAVAKAQRYLSGYTVVNCDRLI